MTKQEQELNNAMKELQINVMKARHLDNTVMHQINEALACLSRDDLPTANREVKKILYDIITQYNLLFNNNCTLL